MNIPNNKTIQELEERHIVITLAPLTDDPSCAYIIKFDNGDDATFWGVSSIEAAFDTIQEEPFGTATVHIQNKIPTIDL